MEASRAKQKIQGCFLSSPIIFTKPNFEGVISFPSAREKFSFSLRFCFDSGIDKKRPVHCCNVGKYEK